MPVVVEVFAFSAVVAAVYLLPKMSLFYPYREEPHVGYWGPVTSQIE